MHRRFNSFRSSSDSSSDNSSDNSSSDDHSSAEDSDASSSDDELARYTRPHPTQLSSAHPHDPANRLQRLRRIFLSQPSARRARKAGGRARRLSVAAPSPRQARQRSPDTRYRYASPRHLRSRRDSAGMQQEQTDDERRGSSSDEDTAARIQLPIDQHIHSLCEQVKRMTVQRESTTSQMHAMLDQAIEELQFLKKQEERSLQSQIKQIEEVSLSANLGFALRLEIFEQQYLAKVADIKQEMETRIQQQKSKCEATILSAAKKLQEKTQVAILTELPAPFVDNGRRSPSTRSHDASKQPSRRSLFKVDPDAARVFCPAQSHHAEDFRSLAAMSSTRNPQSPVTKSRQVDDEECDWQQELSPVSKQKAKLRALEAKLASFSQDSVDRVSSELKRGRRKHSHTQKSRKQVLKTPASVASEVSCVGPSQHEENLHWKPTPLSPLRKNRSYWRNGISLEGKHGIPENDSAAANGEPVGASRKPKSSLSSRFLLPEEEQELRHLRNSIGLAKDWMERHHH